MREILFRGKRKDCNGWETGDYSNYHCSDGTIRHYINGFEYEVYPETVGQYTEMKDKNGNKIFEGDIVSIDSDVKEIFNVDDGEVRYGWGGFYVKEFSSLCSLNTLSSYDHVFRGEVVGNIHDNPDCGSNCERS